MIEELLPRIGLMEEECVNWAEMSLVYSLEMSWTLVGPVGMVIMAPSRLLVVIKAINLANGIGAEMEGKLLAARY